MAENTDLILTPDSKPEARKPWAVGRKSVCPVTGRYINVGSNVILLGDTCVGRLGYKQLREAAIAKAAEKVSALKALIEEGHDDVLTDSAEAVLDKLAEQEALLDGLKALPTLKDIPKSDLLTGNEVQAASIVSLTEDTVCGWDDDRVMRSGTSAVEITDGEGRVLVVARESYTRVLRNVALPLVWGAPVMTTRILYKGGGVVEIDTDPCLHDYIAIEHTRWTGIANGQVRRRDANGNVFSIEVKADVLSITATATDRRIS